MLDAALGDLIELVVVPFEGTQKFFPERGEYGPSAVDATGLATKNRLAKALVEPVHHRPGFDVGEAACFRGVVNGAMFYDRIQEADHPDPGERPVMMIGQGKADTALHFVIYSCI
ncbi:MAG TPA: hypothetical protein PKE55_01545 [Kiritimatiellia bacterium]|nr:hypothetical protein [Kiritimatiellia bacterium]